MSKYEPLRRHLSRRSLGVWTASLPEIEIILGDTLPGSAWTSRAWWTNDKQVQVRSWLNSGWRVEEVDLILKTVTFRRVGSTTDASSPHPKPGP
ncbi:MAG: hypothetical protein ACE5FN_11525 [Leptospirillia bacterium]